MSGEGDLFFRGGWSGRRLSAKRAVSRPMGRLLAPPETVIWVWTGPGPLSLDGRQVVLRGCTEAMYGQGLTGVRLYRSWRRRLVADGEEAKRLLDSEERRVTRAQDSWWLYDVCWSDPDGSSFVVAEQDFDRNDLSFAGWGPRSEPALDAVVQVLDAHSTSGDAR